MASIRAWQWSPASDYISCPRQPWHIDVVVRARLGISRHQLREVFGVGSNANSSGGCWDGKGIRRGRGGEGCCASSRYGRNHLHSECRIKVERSACMTSADDIDAVLDKLAELGFTEETWRKVHHNVRRKTQSTTMDTMRDYRPAGGFKPDDSNDRLLRRLQFIERAYRGLELNPGRDDVFDALAEAAWIAIPPVRV